MDTLITQTLARDLGQDFVAAVEDSLRWGYDTAFERAALPFRASFPKGNAELAQIELEALLRGRREVGMRALVRACEMMGVPYQLCRLECNGRRFVTAQLGQLLLVAEPIRYLSDKPLSAEYKVRLASTHFSVRQFEMDLGDGHKQQIDARNTMLVFLQHGMAGDEFSRRGTALSMFRVAVPNCNLDSWSWHANALNSELELRLDWGVVESRQNVQEDMVRVKLRTIERKEYER